MEPDLRAVKDWRRKGCGRWFGEMPPKMRRALAVVGVVGVGLIVMESLVGATAETIQIDKLIHFFGYAILAMVFVLALKPRLSLLVLALIAAMGVGIEYLQPFFSRSFEWADALADILGVMVGGALGMAVRYAYGALRRDLEGVAMRRNLLHYSSGSTIMRQGETLDHFYVLESGRVKASREVDGRIVELKTLGPGSVLGILGVIEGTPQFATLEAVTRVSLYRMDLDDLVASAGGGEEPLSAVLLFLAGNIKELSDKLARTTMKLKDETGKASDPAANSSR